MGPLPSNRPADRPGAVIEFRGRHNPTSNVSATARHPVKNLIIEAALSGRISHAQARNLIVVFRLEGA